MVYGRARLPHAHRGRRPHTVANRSHDPNELASYEIDLERCCVPCLCEGIGVNVGEAVRASNLLVAGRPASQRFTTVKLSSSAPQCRKIKALDIVHGNTHSKVAATNKCNRCQERSTH